jgi:mannan endo-1,4-beta-mannosidase
VQAYKNYVQKILTRVNTVNGRRYSQDPTVFAFELANEPHTSDNYELNQGVKPGSLVRAWISEMAAFVRSLDPNHMVRASLLILNHHNNRKTWFQTLVQS